MRDNEDEQEEMTPEYQKYLKERREDARNAVSFFVDGKPVPIEELMKPKEKPE